MDANTILQAISSIGFPAVMCVILIYYIKYTTDLFTQMVDKIEDKHADDLTKVTTALNNNTAALTELSLYVRGGKNGTEKSA